MVANEGRRSNDSDWCQSRGLRVLAEWTRSHTIWAFRGLLNWVVAAEQRNGGVGETEDEGPDALVSRLLTVGRFAEVQALIDSGGEFGTDRMRANLASAQGQHELAGVLYARAVAAGDRFAAVDWGVSVIDRGFAPSDELVSALTAALEWDTMAYRLLSDHVRRDVGDLQTAIGLAEDGIDARAANAVLALGWCLYEKGERERALAAALDALGLGVFSAEQLLTWCVDEIYGAESAEDLIDAIAPFLDPRLLEALRDGLRG